MTCGAAGASLVISEFIFLISLSRRSAGVSSLPPAPATVALLQADARHFSGIDCSDFAGWNYNAALGLHLPTGITSQGTTTSTSYTSPTGAASTAYAAVVASSPISYASLVASLKPGDLLYIDGSPQAAQGTGAPSPAVHVIMWLGYTAVDGVFGLPHIIDTTGYQPPHIDVAGIVIPSGPNVRPFAPDGWYFLYFFHASRWIFDAQDATAYFGATASSAVDPVNGFAFAAPTTPTVNLGALSSSQLFASLPVRVAGSLVGSTAHLPLTFDPRGSLCYAQSSAEVLSISLCLAGQRHLGMQQFVQVSPQWAMSIGKELKGIKQPCNGGSPLPSILKPFAAWAASNALTNATVPVLTCDITPTAVTGKEATRVGGGAGDTLAVPCLTGCLPYAELECLGPQDFKLPQYCPAGANYSLGLTGCPTSATTSTAWDPDTVAASNTLAMLNASAGYVPGLTAGPLIWNGPVAWAASDVAAVKTYLAVNGPLAVSMSACSDWQSWMQGCPPGGLYDTAVGQCVSGKARPGFTYAPSTGWYVAPVNTSQIATPFAGPSCKSGTAGHAVTLVGYTQDTWIIRNR